MSATDLLRERFEIVVILGKITLYTFLVSKKFVEHKLFLQ